MDKKSHWEKIYTEKKFEEVSWYQKEPVTSLALIRKYSVATNARIIDVGAGDSYLATSLLKHGFSDITVVDISGAVINRAKSRMAADAGKITWVTADITAFSSRQRFDIWHDRATFHFLTSEGDVVKYSTVLQDSLNPNGFAIIGTFSEQGPTKCSGIAIRQYSAESLAKVFASGFECIETFTEDHITPFGTVQNFVFVVLRRKSSV